MEGFRVGPGYAYTAKLLKKKCEAGDIFGPKILSLHYTFTIVLYDVPLCSLSKKLKFKAIFIAAYKVQMNSRINSVLTNQIVKFRPKLMIKITN